MDNTMIYFVLFLAVIFLIFLITILLKKRSDIDTEISILGMTFKIGTKKTQRMASSDTKKSGVVLDGVKIKGSKIGEIAGRDIKNASHQKGTEATESSQVQIKDTEITDSEINSVSGRDLSRK